ncbi:SPOR domain-containing protein [Nitrosomonas oligotropha]|uniref:DedD protein n=1 Tax=Nitrosomonas oligotropha TaxID=42354 RepID=A0A1H8RYT6_9PROT|nr:SPOR domain-containing protein [Nitrosomonas oligotropha]SDW99538.1 DedD protein [Nitrosomonas oligotropha]SEO71522.1 DedD protein [Nitrosomonas oligotropha]
MNKNISEEELLLRKRARRRLVGAIMLVLAAVIVLPAIFDEPKGGSEKQEIAINLPAVKNNRNDLALKEEPVSREFSGMDDEASPELPGKSKVGLQPHDEYSGMSNDQKRIPIPGIKPKFDRRPVAVVPEVKNNAAVNTPAAAPALVPAPAPAATSASPSAAASVAVPVDAAKAFVVQLGAFSDQAKAKQQQANLLSSGFKAYTETLKVDHNEVTRVRIGPFTTRSAAEAELKKLKKIGLDGVVAPK